MATRAALSAAQTHSPIAAQSRNWPVAHQHGDRVLELLPRDLRRLQRSDHRLERVLGNKHHVVRSGALQKARASHVEDPRIDLSLLLQEVDVHIELAQREIIGRDARCVCARHVDWKRYVSRA